MRNSIAALLATSSVFVQDAVGMIEIPIHKRSVQEKGELPKFESPRVFSRSPTSLIAATDVDESLKDYDAFKITNYMNAQYHGSLSFGSELETHEFIFDTGSPWLWVASTGCASSCHTTDIFNKDESTTFKRLSNKRKELYYETGYASGFVSSDRVCLSQDDSVCVNDMIFIEVDETDKLEKLKVNGVLGLSPGST